MSYMLKLCCVGNLYEQLRKFFWLKLLYIGIICHTNCGCHTTATCLSCLSCGNHCSTFVNFPLYLQLQFCHSFNRAAGPFLTFAFYYFGLSVLHCNSACIFIPHMLSFASTRKQLNGFLFLHMS